MRPVNQPCGTVAKPAGPIPILNSPGLAAIEYRTGNFTSFRRAMLDSITRPNVNPSVITTLAADLGGQATDTTLLVAKSAGLSAPAPDAIRIGNEYLSVIERSGLAWQVARGQRNSQPANHAARDPIVIPSPFEGWTEEGQDDYLVMFLEMWAYLADVLTFYQERIANEAFLPTATQTASVMQLAELTGYRPGPGSSAAALAAFKVAKGAQVTIPARFRVGSPASGGQPAQVFETSTETAARAEHNAIPIASVTQTDQFESVGGVRTVVIEGANRRLTPGDFVLVVENQGAGALESGSVYQLSSVETDPAAGTTSVTWAEPPGKSYNRTTGPVTVYAMRIKASPFGSNAPVWSTLPPSLNGTVDKVDGVRKVDGPAEITLVKVDGPYKDHNWDDPGSADSRIRSGNEVSLDAVYDKAHAPDWMALISGQNTRIFHVTEARTVTAVDYAISAKVTRLRLGAGESIPDGPADGFLLRDGRILTGAEPLPLRDRLPMSNPVAGASLALAGTYPALAKGLKVVFQGPVWDAAAQAPTSEINAESRLIAGAPSIDAARNQTAIVLNAPLVGQYVRSGSVLMANVAEVTQGEAVVDDLLGSSDGSAFQTYLLKRNPLTWLPSTTQASTPLESTLKVSVNGAPWNERTSLSASGPDAQDFMTTVDDQGRTTVVFGDGYAGAIPPTGANNVRASYRAGLGAGGNVTARSIRQLLDTIPGLESVTNPLPAGGGIDPERIGQIRANAPRSPEMFGGIVTVEDYATAALSFPGIVKAQARWFNENPHPYVQLIVSTANQTPLGRQAALAGKLRAFLDERRDPTTPMRIADFSPVYVELTASVGIDNRFPRQATLARVQAALAPGLNSDGSPGFFAFERLGFGQSIYLSAVYAAAQNVPGVSDVLVTCLRCVGPGAADPVGTVRDTICAGPAEILVVENDPTQPGKGSVSVTVAGGGFLDV